MCYCLCLLKGRWVKKNNVGTDYNRCFGWRPIWKTSCVCVCVCGGGLWVWWGWAALELQQTEIMEITMPPLDAPVGVTLLESAWLGKLTCHYWLTQRFLSTLAPVSFSPDQWWRKGGIKNTGKMERTNFRRIFSRSKKYNLGTFFFFAWTMLW